MIDKCNRIVDRLLFIAASYLAIFHFNVTVPYISNRYRTSLKLGYLCVPAFFVISRLLPSRKLQNTLFYAPVGTGTATTKKLLQIYIEDMKDNVERLRYRRSGSSLYSVEDNDMILTIIKTNLEIAFTSELVVYDFNPHKRLSFIYLYLRKMAYSNSESWIKLLNGYNLRPWNAIPKCSVLLRKIKALINYRVWKSPANYLTWHGADGMFDTLSGINE